MIILGLTGSIGMGKSTVAGMFRQMGVPVHDSDAAVHDLYAGPATRLIETAFPGTTADGKVDRTKLAAHVLNDPSALRKLEAIIHPLVSADRKNFLDHWRQLGTACVMLDVPLLFETQQQALADKIIVVSASPEIQRQRVLARPGMTQVKFEKLLAQQISDIEKQRQADYVIATDMPVELTRKRAAEVLAHALAAGSGSFHA